MSIAFFICAGLPHKINTIGLSCAFNTLIAASSLDKEIKAQAAYGGNKEAAKLVGLALGKKALEKGIDTVVFDRGGYLYHGRVQELADGAREAGLKF